MNTNPDTAQFGTQQIDFQMLKGKSSIHSLKQQLQMQNEDNQFQITNSEKLDKKKQSNILLEKTEFILIQEDQVKGQNQHSQKDSNYKCAQSSHQEPIMIVVLDPNLKHSERLLCSKCIGNLEKNSKTLGLQKAMVQTQDIYEKKREFRDIICYKDCKELGELKNNFIKLKSFLNITLDEMIDNTEMQIRDLENYKSQGYKFDHEIDWLIKYQQKVEMDYIVEEIKPLNTRFIKKLSKKLEQFFQFAEYSSCQKILHENISEEKDKDKEILLKKNGNQFISDIEYKYNNYLTNLITVFFKQQYRLLKINANNQKNFIDYCKNIVQINYIIKKKEQSIKFSIRNRNSKLFQNGKQK